MRHGYSRRILAVLGLLLPAAPAWAANPPAAEGPAAKAAETPEAQLRGLIETIREAENPRTAISAYARAAAIDSKSIELHQAHMLRMLRSGLLRIAYYPAGALVRLDPDNGTAWGVLGCAYGRKGDWVEALAATVRAAEQIPDDPSVLNNLGQLTAWYERQLDLPGLPAAVRRSIERHKDEWTRRAAFLRAYQRMKKAYEHGARAADDLTRQAKAAQNDLHEARQKALAIDQQLRDISSEIESREDRIDELRRERYYVYYPRYGRQYVLTDGRLVVYRRHYPRYPLLNRERLDDEIRQEERAVEDLKRQRSTLRAVGGRILSELKDKQRNVGQLEAKLRASRARPEQHFRWDPPAVDGVVVDEVERFPAAREKPAPKTPQQKAQQRLRLARNYIHNALPDSAVPILQEILAQYPDTESAREARAALIKLGEATEN